MIQVTFEDIEEYWKKEWEALPEEEQEANGTPEERKRRYSRRLINPSERLWFWACRNEIRKKKSTTTFTNWSEGNDLNKKEVFAYCNQVSNCEQVSDLMRAHLRLASFVAEGHWNWLSGEWSADTDPAVVEKLFQSLCQRTPFGVGFYKDLRQNLVEQDEQKIVNDRTLRHADRVQPMNLLLLDEGQSGTPGVLAKLILELIRNGDGSIYPIPSQSLLGYDSDFRQTIENAHMYIRDGERLWREGYDVRWRLELPKETPLPLILRGGSAGGAFALGLAKLFVSD